VTCLVMMIQRFVAIESPRFPILERRVVGYGEPGGVPLLLSPRPNSSNAYSATMFVRRLLLSPHPTTGRLSGVIASVVLGHTAI